MLQPKKPLDLSEANQILQSERKPLDLSSAEAILKKKESTESTSTSQEKNLESVQTVGSLDGVGSNGFPAIDVNLGVPGLKPDLKTVEQLANPPKSKATIQAEQNNALKYQKFKEFSTLPDEIKKENAQKVEDEVNGIGFLNNVATFGKEAYNTVIEGMSNTPMTAGLKQLKVNTEPLADEKKEAKDLMIRQGVKPKDINSNTILELAKKIKLQKLNDSDIESRKKEFLSNTEVDFEDLQKGANVELSKISNKDKELLKQKAILEPVLRDSDNRLTELNKQLANFKKNNQQPTPEFVDEYNYAIKYHNDILKDVQKTDNQFADNRDKIGDLKTNLDLFKRQYGKVNNFVSNIGATALDLAAGGFGIVDYGFNAAYGALGIDTGPKENSEIVTGLRNASQKIRDRIAKPINVDNIEDIGDFGDWMANTVIANQVPIYGLIATGPGGIVALGGSSLGTKYGDMIQEMNPDHPVEGQILKDYSNAELAWKPVGFGIAETASALVDAHIMKGAARVLASATEPERRLISQTIAKRLLEVGKQTVKGGIEEAVDESATQGVENLIDGKPFTEGMKDAGGAGGAMGALIPFFAGNIAAATKSFSIDNKIQNSAKKTLALEKELANPNLSEDAKKIIKTNFEESKKTTENLLKKQVKDISKMPNENFQEILRIENEQAKLKEKAIEIKTQETLPNDIKKQLLSDFSTKFNELETDRVDILSGKKTMPIIEKENEKPQEVAVTEAQPQAEVPQQAEAEKVEIKNEGKADAPTKENVQERLNINNPFYKKINDALVKLGLIEQYNPETGTGDMIGGVAQPLSDKGGFAVGDMYFYPDGSISHVSAKGTVQFDKNGNVISENTKQVAQEAKKTEIEGIKSSIASLEKTRDSESFKYKEVTEIDVLGNRKKVKRLKTTEELKESTDKINAAIDKAKSRLTELEKNQPQEVSPVEDVVAKSISKEEYADFVDNNNVSDERLNSIAEKVKNQEKLSEQENAIFVGKTSEINKIIADAGKENGDITPDGNLSTRTSELGESGTTEQQSPAKESVPSAFDGGKSEGNIKITQEPTLEDISNFLNENFNKNEATPNQNKTKSLFTGRKKEIKDFKETKGEFIFFSQNEGVAEKYGEVTRADVDTENFLDLSSQEKKSELIESMTDDEIIKVFKIKESDRSRFPKPISEEVTIFKESVKDGSQRFSAQGELQTSLLRYIKSKGYDGVVLQDAQYGKLDNSYVVFNKNVINKNEATPTNITPTDGNVQSRTSNVGESGTTEQQSSSKESVPSSVDVGKSEGKINESTTAGENTEIGKSKNDVSNEKTPSRKESRKKIAEAKIDDIVSAINGIDNIFGIKIKVDDVDGLNKNGIDIVNVIASIVKQAVNAGIDVDEAIKKTIEHFKKTIDFEVNIDDVKEKLGVEKEISKDELSDFRDLIRDIPQKDEVKNYLSGETIERVFGEQPRNDQSYNVVSLADLASHGKLVMDKAKELFGDQYVEKTLYFLENSNLEADEKAIQYVALENEMDKRVSENPNDLGERKLQDLVRKKSQAHLRKSAIAINAGRLRAIMKYGIDVNSYPDGILTSKQKQAKNEIEKLVQHTSEDINKEAEIQEEEGFVIAEPKAKRDKAIVKSEISDVIKKLRADLIKSARGQSINISIPYAEQVRIATPHIIKLSKLFAELGGMKTKEIIDAIHDELSKVFPDIKKSDVSSVLKEVYEEKAKPKDKKIQDIVKQALIDAGFSRKVKIKGEEKTLLDWKKLAGEESSIPKLKENVEKSLKAQGYTDSQIKEIGKSLEDEYIRLGADIVEKGLRELENRNKLKPSPTRKTDAKRLSELYNYGLFNGEKATEYDNLLNKTLGLSEFDVETYQKIKSLAKALASVYNQENNGRKISEIAVQTLNSTINHQIKSLLATSALKDGTKAFNAATAFDDYVGLSMRALLGSVSTLTENKISGEFQVQLQKAFSSGEITPELKKQIEADKKAVFRDITRNAGLFYGDTNTSLTHSSRFEEWLNGKADKAMAHTVVSSLMLRAFLDGVDSSIKVRLTQKAFVKNVIKLLTSETNPNGKMSTEEAIKYVSEQLTGENFEKALKTAKSIIENVNEEQGEKVIKDTDEAIHRFAMDLVKENLLSSNMLTMDNIESAYKSAYKSAGRSIGHEANNIISAGVNLLNSTLNKRLEKAIQEKNYPLATSLTLLSTIQKSILNLFVGGGTNWVILGLEKSGNPLGYISVIHNATERRKLDLSENKTDITQSLYRESVYKDSAVRLLVGTGIAMATFAVLTAGDDDEELLGKLNQWLKDNPWAKKHFNKLAPEAVTFLIDMKNGELSKHWQRVLGMKNDYFDNTKTLINTFSDENSSMSGAFGAFVGQNLSSPGPWKTIKDVRDILRGLKGLPEIKTDYKTSSFWNGYFREGFVDFAKLRPGVNYDLNYKIDKVKDDSKKLNSEIDSFVKKIYDDKLPNDQINKKINELFDKEPLKKEKIINAIKNRAAEEKLKRSGVDPFYIRLKRESNDEIKAILFQDRFKDLSKTTPAEQKEIEKGMNAIKFGEGSEEFWNTYWRLAHPENYKNKPIN